MTPPGVKAGVHLTELPEAAQKQSGAHQQDQRQCDFADHQGTVEALMTTAGRLSPAFGQGSVDIGACDLQNRRQPKQQSCPDGYGQGKQQDRRVETDLIGHGQMGRQQGQGEADSGLGQCDAENTAQQGQHNGFGEQLARQPWPDRSHRQPDGDLLSAGC